MTTHNRNKTTEITQPLPRLCLTENTIRQVFAILALTTGLVAAAAKAPEGDVVFRVSEEEDGAGFEHEQFWVDREGYYKIMGFQMYRVVHLVG